MKLETARKIKNAAAYLEFDSSDITIHEDYSGRGMYGKTTSGVSGDLGEIVQAIAAAVADCQTDDERQALIDDLNVAHDSMGRGIILY